MVVLKTILTSRVVKEKEKECKCFALRCFCYLVCTLKQSSDETYSNSKWAKVNLSLLLDYLALS